MLWLTAHWLGVHDATLHCGRYGLRSRLIPPRTSQRQVPQENSADILGVPRHVQFRRRRRSPPLQQHTCPKKTNPERRLCCGSRQRRSITYRSRSAACPRAVVLSNEPTCTLDWDPSVPITEHELTCVIGVDSHVREYHNPPISWIHAQRPCQHTCLPNTHSALPLPHDRIHTLHG